MAQVTLSLFCFAMKLSTTETLLSIHQATRPADASWLTFHILAQPQLSNSTTTSISLTAGLIRQMMLSFGPQHQSDQELSHQKENLAPAKLLLVLVVLAIVVMAVLVILLLALVVLAIVALAVLVMAVLAAVATILPSFAMLVLPIVMQVIMLTAVTMVLPMAILVGPVITQAATETVVTMVLRTDILVVLEYTVVMVLLKTQLANGGTQLTPPSPNGC